MTHIPVDYDVSMTIYMYHQKCDTIVRLLIQDSKVFRVDCPFWDKDKFGSFFWAEDVKSVPHANTIRGCTEARLVAVRVAFSDTHVKAVEKYNIR